jgi:hypothetical protein
MRHDYLTRCGAALSHGQSAARIGLLWPARAAWSHHHPKGHRLVRWVEEDLTATMELLDELHFGFLCLPEDDLTTATVERVLDGPLNARPSYHLRCGSARLPLETVVLPSVTSLSRAAWQKLEEFVAVGGKVVCLGIAAALERTGAR